MFANNDCFDFTESRYTELLHEAKKRPVVPYDNLDWNKGFLLWRHDVDFSLKRALALGKIESDLGIVATYFILLRGEYYNPLEKEQSKIIHQLISLGHRIAIHFDATLYSISSEHDLEEALRSEIFVFNKILGVTPRAFSFHNPDKRTQCFKAKSYAGLINCYSAQFASIGYGSDSNGYWRHRNLFSLLNDQSIAQLQVLTHPVWWQPEVSDPRDRVIRSMFDHFSSQLYLYDKALDLANRENISHISKYRQTLEKTISKEELTYIDILWAMEKNNTLYTFLRHLSDKLKNQSDQNFTKRDILELLKDITLEDN